MSRDKLKIQVISVPQCQSVGFEVIQSVGTFHKASRPTLWTPVAAAIYLDLL